MAGHSKWSNIKRKKEVNDAKKSKIFTKMVKEIAVAARTGGGDPAFNPRLRLAIQNAKGANMPKEAILRAISKGRDEETSSYQEVIYEGYGSHGVAIMVVCMTDKLTRTVANIRSIFFRHGGSLEKNGSISFLFHHKGVFTLPLSEIPNEEAVLLELIDAGAEEVEKEGDYLYTTCSVEHFGKVQKQLEELAIVPLVAELQYIPHTFVELDDQTLLKLIKLIDALKDDEDVQHVYHNIAVLSQQESLWVGHLDPFC